MNQTGWRAKCHAGERPLERGLGVSAIRWRKATNHEPLTIWLPLVKLARAPLHSNSSLRKARRAHIGPLTDRAAIRHNRLWCSLHLTIDDISDRSEFARTKVADVQIVVAESLVVFGSFPIDQAIQIWGHPSTHSHAAWRKV